MKSNPFDGIEFLFREITPRYHTSRYGTLKPLNVQYQIMKIYSPLPGEGVQHQGPIPGEGEEGGVGGEGRAPLLALRVPGNGGEGGTLGHAGKHGTWGEGRGIFY